MIKVSDGKFEKNDSIIEDSSSFTEDSSLSIIPATGSDNKSGAAQAEMKKVDNTVTGIQKFLSILVTSIF